MRLLIVAGMLTLALSASLTPANAALIKWCSGNPDTAIFRRAAIRHISVPLALESYCLCQCGNEATHDHAALLTRFDDKKLQACQSKCVNAFEASRR
jgi:hypothetical protein